VAIAPDEPILISVGRRRFAVAIGVIVVALAGCGGTAARRPFAAHPRLVPLAARVPARAVTHPAPRAAKPIATKTPPASQSRCHNVAPPVPQHPIDHRQWLSGVVITEYYPARESWFIGRHVPAPGLRGKYPVDFLYSARGLAMEGDGLNYAGHIVQIAQLGSTGWVNAAGQPTLPVCLGKWTHGFPVWLRGGWRNAAGAVTFPLAAGGWSNGSGVKTLPYGGVTFAPATSLPLRYYHSIAVDPRLIPLGSRVYVPAYRAINGGWFVAQDIGGAIKGHHIDVYRPPPSDPADLGRYLTNQRILVIPPGA
jgi:3D (Asp-Asp-Asp) domain-containing protein